MNKREYKKFEKNMTNLKRIIYREIFLMMKDKL